MQAETDSSLEIRTFGGVEIQHGGRRVHIRGRKAIALLLYLVVERHQRHSRESLLGLLWPEMNDRDARNNLRVVQAQLRRKLGVKDGATPYVASDRHNVWFEDNGRSAVDLWTFQDLLTRCQVHIHADRRSCPECRQRLVEATNLYTGDFLSDFHVAGCPAFDEWLYVWRERMHIQVLSLLAELTQVHETAGALDTAVAFARRQIELDPLQEASHRDLLRLYDRQNKRPQALAQFDTLRKILQQELGVEPDAETVSLWQLIKGSTQPGAEHSASAVTGIHNLPENTTPFIGREEEIRQISLRLEAGGYRLLTLVGPGGIGKTRLAIEAARENLILFADGVYFISLAALNRSAAIPDAIATAVGLSLADSQGAASDLLISALASKRMLLIIDNLEHLMAGADFLMALLQGAPHLRLLVTSRERLDVQSEDLFHINGLPFPKEGELAQAGAFAAVRLFCDRAYRLRKGFKLTPKNTPHVARICQIVSGMPLGIELAATWVRDFTTAELAQALSEKLEMLATTMRDIAPQHRSMEMVFDTSWRLLTTAEQQLFARLSVFQGDFSRAAATAVADATPMTLVRLRYQSLVHATETGRYALHDVLRQFAMRALAREAEETESIRARHAAYYLACVGRQAAALHGEAPQTALQAIEQDLENVRQAWRWAVANGRFFLLQEGITGLARFYAQSGRYNEGEEMMTIAIQLCKQMGATAGDDQAGWQLLHLRLLTELINFLNMLSEMPRLRHAAAEAVARSAELQDAAGEARALLSLALAHLNYGDNEGALPLLERGLQRARMGKEPEIEGLLLRHIGNVWRQRGNLDREAEYLQQAWVVQRALGFRAEEQTLLLWLTMNRYRLGDFTAGLTYLVQARELNTIVGDPSRASKVDYVQGLIEQAVGEYEAARRHFQAALQANVALDDWWQQSYALMKLGAVNCKLGEPKAGVQQAKTAVQIAAKHSLGEASGDALITLGHIYERMANWTEAQDAYRKAHGYYKKIGNPAALAETQIGLAYTAWQLEDATAAKLLLKPALPLLDGRYLGTTQEPMWLYLAAFRILRASGDGAAVTVQRHAFTLLNRLAADLIDPSWRQLFLERVSVNRALLSAEG
ncbi:MAG: hypothetical protein CL608_20765 [Anaerolineaceae bacterium]|nr:hypothetical protein [Anaerolineaceae bacterium]